VKLSSVRGATGFMLVFTCISSGDLLLCSKIMGDSRGMGFRRENKAQIRMNALIWAFFYFCARCHGQESVDVLDYFCAAMIIFAINSANSKYSIILNIYFIQIDIADAINERLNNYSIYSIPTILRLDKR
jgi:hypothetical protein